MFLQKTGEKPVDPSRTHIKGQSWLSSRGHSLCPEEINRRHQNISALELLLAWFGKGWAEGEDTPPVDDTHCLVSRAHSGAQSLNKITFRQMGMGQFGWYQDNAWSDYKTIHTHPLPAIKQSKSLLQLSWYPLIFVLSWFYLKWKKGLR